MRLFYLSLFLGFISVSSIAQTGLTENFNDNITDANWTLSPPASFTLIETNSELKVTTNSAGPAYENISYSFPALDLSQISTVKIKVKSSKAFTMRVDLIDVTGKSTNASPVIKSITAGTTYVTYTFDFTGKFSQNVPVAATVDKSQINQMVVFFNAGGTAFTNTVYFDDLIIGDANAGAPYGIRVNQVGYELKGPKSAVVSYSSKIDSTTFNVINTTNTIVYTGTLSAQESVTGWQGRLFKTADFSAFQEAGIYRIKVGSAVSHPFEIGNGLLFNKTAFSIVDFFKSMRSTHTPDHQLSFYGTRNDIVDVYGGWRDATGDPGKHMSHLSYANHLNPQQIPFVVWSLLKSYQQNTASFSDKSAALLSESAWGADYLLRNIDKNDGYLYIAIFDDWGAVSATREVCEWGQPLNNAARTANYQSAMREGAGIAIAALAKSYTMNIQGDSTAAQYLRGAKRLYAHLKSPGNGYLTKNLEYCNDHSENIIDEYCGLLAAVELYTATSEQGYFTDAQLYAGKLMSRIQAEGWFRSDDAAKRPFYHAADEGLPLLALVEYAGIDQTNKPAVHQVLSSSLKWYFQITNEVSNPFQYIRQYAAAFKSNALQTPIKSFFMPHENETGYWWQGENARLASMTTAMLMAARHLDSKFIVGTDSITSMAISQLDWILGKNPFDVCMMTGFGTINYPNYPGASALANIKAGICNGITSKDSTESDISWMPHPANDWKNWRWIEQWLPHDAWFLLAVSAIENIQKNPPAITGKLNSRYAENFVIGPNPFSDVINIHNAEIKSARVFDITGKTLLESVFENRQQINTSDIKPGIYFIELQLRDRSIIRKIVKI